MIDPITGSVRRLSEILPRQLYQSGRPTPLHEVLATGVNAIIAVGSGLQPWREKWTDRVREKFEVGTNNRQAIYAHIPLIDCGNCLDEQACNAAIRLGASILMDEGRTLLVHCDAGMFRSVHVSAGILAAVLGIDGKCAFRRVDAIAIPRGEPRECLGLRGWDEHVETFGPEATPIEGG